MVIHLSESPVDLKSLLGSISVPSDAESETVRQFILEKETDLSQLDDEITRVQTLLDSLLQKRCKTQTSLDEHRALFSPVRRIPPEILRDIFVLCLPDDEYVRPSVSQAPLLMGQVSHAWRKLALSHPRLWASLEIFSSIPTASAAAWIGRTSLCPLSLSLFLVNDRGGDHIVTEAAIRSHLQTFLSHASHWKRLRIIHCFSLDKRITLSNLFPLQIPQDGTPLLEHLDLRLPIKTNQPLFPDYSRVPRLHSLGFYGPYPSLECLELPGAQLTHLTLELGTSVEECLKVFSQTPGLTCCKCRLFSVPEDLVSTTNVLLGELRSLEVSGNKSQMQTLISNLTLPALHYFSIRCTKRFLLAPHLVALVSRSSCRLNNLYLRVGDISEDDLIDCLQCVSASLVHLSIQGRRSPETYSIGDRVVTLLTQSNLEGLALCPELECITLEHCISSSDGTLATMVESRNIQSFQGPPLRIVVVELPKDNVDDYRRLQALGMEIQP